MKNVRIIITTKRNAPTYNDLILCINGNCNLPEVVIKFSDLQEMIRKLKFSSISNLIVTDVPSYRHPNFDYSVAKYVFNKAHIEEYKQHNSHIAYLIFGEFE